MAVANSTTDHAVFRSDGIQLYGLDAEIELKMQGKRDKNYEKEISKWIEQVSGEKLEFEDIGESLKSGIVLCKLLNVIQPGTVKNINTRPIALMQVENIQLYLKGCWHLGVPTSDLFVTSDLFQLKGIPQVLQNIVSLARVAQTLPNYKGPTFGPKLSAPAPAKKWETVETNQAVFANEQKAKQTAAAAQVNICFECGSPKKHLAKMCDVCGSDMSKQSPIELAKVLATLHEIKAQLAQVQSQRNQTEEENKKLMDQLKATTTKSITTPTTPVPTSISSSTSTKSSGTTTSSSSSGVSTTSKGSYIQSSSSNPSTPTKGPSGSSSSIKGSTTTTTTIIVKPRSGSNPPVPAQTKTEPVQIKPPVPGKQDPKPSAQKPAAGIITAKLEPQKPDPDKAKLEQDKAALEKELEKQKAEKLKLGAEKAKFDQEKAKFEQEKTKLAQEKAKLAQENDKLAKDFQTLDKKYREEVGKAKTLDDRTKLLEKKLDAAGLASRPNLNMAGPSSAKPAIASKPVSESRYRPTLEYH